MKEKNARQVFAVLTLMGTKISDKKISDQCDQPGGFWKGSVDVGLREMSDQ